MSQPIPGHHQNEETVRIEPVCIFTDKAVVPPRAGSEPTPPSAGDASQDQATLPPPEQKQGD